MTPRHFAIAACTVFLLLLAACSSSTPFDALETKGRQAEESAPPLNTEGDITRAIAAMRFTALQMGVGFVIGREKSPNGAESGVHEFACSEAGFARFDETRKESTYFDCQVSVLGLGSFFLDGFVDENCRGHTGDIYCLGRGTPEEPFLSRFFDNDEEVGGEAHSFSITNTAYTDGTDETISATGSVWRIRPTIIQAGIATEGFRLIQDRTAENSNEARDSHADFFGSVLLSSDDAFNCVNGRLMMVTTSTVTANVDGDFVNGQVRISNSLGESVVAAFLPDGSVIYRGTANGAGVIRLENLKKHCPDFTISSASDDPPNSVALRMFSPTISTRQKP